MKALCKQKMRGVVFSEHRSNQLNISGNMLSFSIPSRLPDASVKHITLGAWVRIYGNPVKPYTSLLIIR